MKTIAILGHFAFGEDKANGQTIKTKIIATELRRVCGDAEVDCYDTNGGLSFLMRLPFVLFTILRTHRNVIILPAYKAVCIITPILVLMNLAFRRRLHFVVIGGRLPLLIRKFPFLKPVLRRFHRIYPETRLMVQELMMNGIANVIVMPNCKPLQIVHPDQLKSHHTPPFMLCTFSRVERTKGIEDAVMAVRECNRMAGLTLFHLDIYGLVQEKEWFEQLMSNQPEEEITYRGVIPFEKSTDVLCQYFSMLFPTYYPGEGFAGTLIDALAAGLPVVASDWRANGEIVEKGKTGYLCATHATDELVSRLMYISAHPGEVDAMRMNCINKAADYLPEKAIKGLTDQIL